MPKNNQLITLLPGESFSFEMQGLVKAKLNLNLFYKPPMI
jgi:hypothetical protein